jgi:hypothetical protein
LAALAIFRTSASPISVDFYSYIFHDALGLWRSNGITPTFQPLGDDNAASRFAQSMFLLFMYFD